MKKFWTGVFVTVLVVILIPVIVIGFGLVDMSAQAGPGTLETIIAGWTVDRSVEVRAPEEKNLYTGDPQAIAIGLEHYGSMCVRCHGAPDVEADEFAQGLDPPAPDLREAAEEFTDGELFWIIKNGIRMTGMPAFGPSHSDEDLWRLAAFVRHLPDLTEAEKASLKEAREAGHHGGHER